MSNRRTLQHLDKVLRDQKVAPVSINQPDFLFDSTSSLVTVTPEWLRAQAEELRADGSSDLWNLAAQYEERAFAMELAS